MTPQEITQEVESWNTQETIDFLEKNFKLLKTGDIAFYTSIKNQYQKYGNISGNQLFWLKKFCLTILSEGQLSKNPDVKNTDKSPLEYWQLLSFPAILKLINTARESGLKYPSIQLEYQEKSFGTIRIKICYSPHFNCIQIKVSDGYFCSLTAKQGNIYCITKERKWFNEIGPSVFEFLQDFEKDPISGAKLQARKTSNCCFCCNRLTDPRSVLMGYGPTCADNFGLPWGDEHDDIPF